MYIYLLFRSSCHDYQVSKSFLHTSGIIEFDIKITSRNIQSGVYIAVAAGISEVSLVPIRRHSLPHQSPTISERGRSRLGIMRSPEREDCCGAAHYEPRGQVAATSTFTTGVPKLGSKLPEPSLKFND